MKRILFILFFFSVAFGQDCTVALTVQDSIGAGTYDFLKRGLEKAVQKDCDSVFLRINTPGGHLQSTRLITELILSSPKPFLCLISPAGGHAGSAGAILLQACHVSGGLTATHLGAATPVVGSGQELPPDLRNKMVNDTVSWVKGLTELRGRNFDFSEKIITEGKSLTSEEAVKIKALDLLSLSEKEFLEKAKGRKVKDQERKEILVEIGTLEEFPRDARYSVLQWISEPEWAYLIFMGALLLLYAEFSHPGLFLPGVIGAILLLLSMMAFHKLEANYGGLALLILGLAFWVAELFITSKGILGIAGTLSFVLGSLLLFDHTSTGYRIPISYIGFSTLVFGGLSSAMAYLAAKTLRTPQHDFDEKMKTTALHILGVSPGGRSGQLQALGEIWNFESDDNISLGDPVEFVQRKNLILKVRKK